MAKHRFTIKDLAEMTDDEILRILVRERKNALSNPQAPLYERLQKIHNDLDRRVHARATGADMDVDTQQLIRHARSAYLFLVDDDADKSNRELAEAIKKSYDLRDPQNKAVYDCLMDYPNLRGETP